MEFERIERAVEGNRSKLTVSARGESSHACIPGWDALPIEGKEFYWNIMEGEVARAIERQT